MPAAKLKIGFVVDDGLDELDGVQRYIVDLGAWLTALGHEVHFLAGQTSRTDIPNIHSLARNIKVRFNGNSLSIPLPTGRRKLRRFLSKQRFDVLHIQIPHSPFMSQKLILAADPKAAIIGTFHIAPFGWMSAIGNRLLGIWLRPSLKRFDTIVSVSSTAAEFARKSFKIQTEVLPNVIDYQHFKAAQPLQQYDNHKLNILFLGRLVPRKGCHLLLEAVNQLKDKELPGFRVVVCGKGPLEAQLRRYVDQNNLSDLVEFVGFVSEKDKPKYCASSDISVFPSSGGESFGIVLLEAMAGGRAVVLAGDNPGYRSVMAPQPDLLFDPADAAALAGKLEKYLKNDKKRHQMAEWAGNYASGFDVNLIGHKLLKIYLQALRKRAQL